MSEVNTDSVIIRLLDDLIEEAEWKGMNEQIGYAAGDPKWEEDRKSVADARKAVLKVLGWRLIETAPKDGTYVDVWTEYPKDAGFSAKGDRFPDVFWNGRDWVWEFEGMWPTATDSGGTVTHWMPIPDDPK